MNIIRDYQSALDFLYSFIDYSLTRDLHYSTEKFNLNRMVEFLGFINNPHLSYKVIHVAGTKGKGSICAMVTSILSQAGYKTGFYSSPHLIEFTERIRIGDELIQKDEVIKYCNQLMEAIEKVKNISTFEVVTGLAFKYFADQKVDFAVIEVGMGGRLDATNVVHPMVTAISSISYDHTQLLGKTLEKIAFEKAGIIKNGIPVVLVSQKKTVEKVINTQAENKQAKLIHVNRFCKHKRIEASLKGQKVQFTIKRLKKDNHRMPESNKIINIFTPLIGDHQIENMSAALLVVEKIIEEGWHISDQAIENGLREIKWQGRFEIIHQHPLIIVDGAHNVDSFIKLHQTIREYLNGKKIILLFGVSDDKQVKLMLKEIQPAVDYLIITQSTHPRAMETRLIEKNAYQLHFNYCIQPDIRNALRSAIKLAGQEYAIIASGSLFIAGAVKEIVTKSMLDNA